MSLALSEFGGPRTSTLHPRSARDVVLRGVLSVCVSAFGSMCYKVRNFCFFLWVGRSIPIMMCGHAVLEVDAAAVFVTAADAAVVLATVADEAAFELVVAVVALEAVAFAVAEDLPEPSAEDREA